MYCAAKKIMMADLSLAVFFICDEHYETDCMETNQWKKEYASRIFQPRGFHLLSV